MRGIKKTLTSLVLGTALSLGITTNEAEAKDYIDPTYQFTVLNQPTGQSVSIYKDPIYGIRVAWIDTRDCTNTNQKSLYIRQAPFGEEQCISGVPNEPIGIMKMWGNNVFWTSGDSIRKVRGINILTGQTYLITELSHATLQDVFENSLVYFESGGPDVNHLYNISNGSSIVLDHGSGKLGSMWGNNVVWPDGIIRGYNVSTNSLYIVPTQGANAVEKTIIHGNKLTFENGSEGDIYSINLDGTNQTLLINEPGIQDLGDFSNKFLIYGNYPTELRGYSLENNESFHIGSISQLSQSSATSLSAMWDHTVSWNDNGHIYGNTIIPEAGTIGLLGFGVASLFFKRKK